MSGYVSNRSVSQLAYAKGSITTPNGAISVDYRRDEKVVVFKIYEDSPSNASFCVGNKTVELSDEDTEIIVKM